MSSFLPDGFTVRPATVADGQAVTDLIRAVDLAAKGESDTTVDDLLDWWRLFNLERDSWVVEADGRLAAYAAALLREAYDVDGGVHPDFRGRGLGTALLRLTEERARDVGAPRIFNVCLVVDAGAVELFERNGYTDQRHFYRMVIDLDGATPEPQCPQGLTIDTFRRDDARAFHAALDEAFADEWNFHPLPFEEWSRLRLDVPDFDPGLWFVVRDGDELAAVLRGETNRFGMGWVAALGVRPRWRKRGLGLALLHHAFREFHRRGETRAGLGVDTENPTGATRLYRRAGMRVQWEGVVYGKELA
jgi:mycothiol synthase